MKSVIIFVLGILLVSSAVWAETFSKKEFTITLPTGWGEPFSREDRDALKRLVLQDNPFARTQPYDYWFYNMEDKASPFAGVGIEFRNTKYYSDSELHTFPSPKDSAYLEREDDTTSPLQNILSAAPRGTTIFDKRSGILWTSTYQDDPCLLAAIPTSKGVLLLSFECSKLAYFQYEPIFYNIATSVTLAPSLSRNTAEMPFSSDGIFAKLSPLAPELIRHILAVAVAALISAIFVRIACKMIAKFKPPYGMAYKAAFLGYLSSVLVGFGVGFVIGALGQSLTGTSAVLLIIFGFFVQAAIYSKMIKHPETGAIGFGKACQVIIVQWILGVVLMSTLAVIIWYWRDISQLFFHN